MYGFPAGSASKPVPSHANSIVNDADPNPLVALLSLLHTSVRAHNLAPTAAQDQKAVMASPAELADMISQPSARQRA